MGSVEPGLKTGYYGLASVLLRVLGSGGANLAGEGGLVTKGRLGIWRWCCCVVWLLLATVVEVGAIAADPAPTSAIYRLRVVLTTTSDWTSAGFTGAAFVGFLERVVEGAGAQELRVQSGVGELGVGKRAFDETKVVVEYEAYFTEVQGPWLTLTIGKGHIGFTRLEFYEYEPQGGETQPLLSFTHRGVANPRDPENPRRFLIPAGSLLRGEPVTSSQRAFPRLALAFYYPWYGTPTGSSGQWIHWDPSRPNFASTHTPLEGYYDSLDEATLTRHVHQAQEAGIHGFISSWWGPGTFEDRAFQELLAVAEREGFLVTVYYEQAHSRLQIVRDLSYVVRRYGESPAFLKVDGVPAIFIYGRVTEGFSPEDWQFVFGELEERGVDCFCIGDGLGATGPQGDAFLFQGFGGVHVYIPVGIPVEELGDFYEAGELRARVKGMLFAATVVPGYDDRVIRTPGFSVDRQDGAYYRQTWEAAMASDPDWILITSFNEWHEGTEIEPSVELGRRYLHLTRELIQAWLGN